MREEEALDGETMENESLYIQSRQAHLEFLSL